MFKNDLARLLEDFWHTVKITFVLRIFQKLTLRHLFLKNRIYNIRVSQLKINAIFMSINKNHNNLGSFIELFLKVL